MNKGKRELDILWQGPKFNVKSPQSLKLHKGERVLLEYYSPCISKWKAFVEKRTIILHLKLFL